MKRTNMITLAVTVLSLAVLACNALSLPGGDGSLFSDDFSGADSTWGIGTDADSSVQYASGGLQMQVFTENFFVWSTPNDSDYSNIHIEVMVNDRSADADTAVGIMCNQQVTTDAFYYLALTPNGQYAIARAAVAQDDFFLTGDNEWADSDVIPLDQASYRIGADCANGTLTLYVNGQQVASVTDSTYTGGGVGLFTWSHDELNGSDVTFDDFIVTAK